MPSARALLNSAARTLPWPQLVLYFLSVLIREGWAFCRRLQQHQITVPGLRDSWFQTKVDLSDPQWRDFRNSMVLLGAVFTGFVALSRSVRGSAPARAAGAMRCAHQARTAAAPGPRSAARGCRARASFRR